MGGWIGWWEDRWVGLERGGPWRWVGRWRVDVAGLGGWKGSDTVVRALHQVALCLAQGDGITPLKVLTLIGLTPPMVLHRMALRRNTAFSTSSTLCESRKVKAKKAIF